MNPKIAETDYVKHLEKAGYRIFVDNGEGIADSLFTTILKKDDLVVTVVYVKKTYKAYISAEYKQPLSDHLFYNDQNDRIATWITQYKNDASNVSFSDLSKEDYNKIIEKFFYFTLSLS